MAVVRFGDTACELAPGESVLEGLERSGVRIPNSCRAGACKSCLLQATAGPIPAAAQVGLKDTFKSRGYFLSCMCRPESDLEARTVGSAEDLGAEITEITRLSPTVARVRLRPDKPLAYEPGQFVTLMRSDGLARSYSLASLAQDELLELHVRWMPEGRMSTWLHQTATAGERVVLRGPLGECFYTPGAPERPLLLAGTGTGLAPLWGIAREALRQGHQGPITLLHGGRDQASLYLRDELASLASQHANFTYLPCVLDASASGELTVGALDQLSCAQLTTLGKPGQVRAYVCGNPEIVRKLKKALFLAGMSSQNIFADAFVTARPPASAGAT